MEQAHAYDHPTGVYRTSWGNAWFVQFQFRGQRYYLGTFDSVADAVTARQNALDQLAERA